MFCAQVRDDFTELFDGGFEVFDDLLGENVRIGESVGFFEAFVSEQKMWRLALSRADLNALKNQNLLFLRPELITLGKSDTNALPVHLSPPGPNRPC